MKKYFYETEVADVFVPYRGLFNFNDYVEWVTDKVLVNVFVPYRGLFNFNNGKTFSTAGLDSLFSSPIGVSLISMVEVLGGKESDAYPFRPLSGSL